MRGLKHNGAVAGAMCAKSEQTKHPPPTHRSSVGVGAANTHPRDVFGVVAHSNAGAWRAIPSQPLTPGVVPGAHKLPGAPPGVDAGPCVARGLLKLAWVG